MFFPIDRELELTGLDIGDLGVRVMMELADGALIEGILDDHHVIGVRKDALLILDDSASALDFATDAALRKALSKLPWKPTVVLISQRVSSIRHADKIVVLDDGHMAGLGTHTQLQQTCPVYQEICRSQEKGEASAS